MAQAQTPANSSTKLAFAIPNLFGPDGLTLPNPNHVAHFDSDFQANFGPFNAAIGSQLTSLPLPSPASGFTYTFDPDAGSLYAVGAELRPDPGGARRDHRQGKILRRIQLPAFPLRHAGWRRPAQL